MDGRRKLVASVVAVAALAGGGAAVAADRLGAEEQQAAVIDDAAARLGVEPSELSDALADALAEQLDAAVAAGRLTEEQAGAMKERLAAGDAPLLALPGGGHHGGPAGPRGLDAAAAYLGLTEAELREQLMDGSTLAEVAGAEGKTVDGLVQAMVADAKETLADAVADGRLTAEQRSAILADLSERITERVNNAGPGPGRGGPHPGGFGGPWGALEGALDDGTDAGADA